MQSYLSFSNINWTNTLCVTNKYRWNKIYNINSKGSIKDKFKKSLRSGGQLSNYNNLYTKNSIVSTSYNHLINNLINNNITPYKYPWTRKKLRSNARYINNFHTFHTIRHNGVCNYLNNFKGANTIKYRKSCLVTLKRRRIYIYWFFAESKYSLRDFIARIVENKAYYYPMHTNMFNKEKRKNLYYKNLYR